MFNILIADDHPIFRIGIKHILDEDPGMFSTEEADNGDEALEKVLNNDFDVVLLDIAMPGKDGLEILKKIKKEKPNLPVLMLSMFPEKQFAIRALKIGASGYLTKGNVSYELLTAIRKVSKGRKYISSSLAEQLASYLDDDRLKLLHESLTNREFQVMQLLCSGKNRAEIAEELSISPKTLSVFRSKILKKMDLKNNVELSHYAIKHNLIK